jgi:hypothetical protein
MRTRITRKSSRPATPINSRWRGRSPAIEKIEAAKVWPKEDGSPPPLYRLLDMYFADYDAASKAMTTDEARAFFKTLFAVATGGVRIAFAAVQDS